MRKSFMVAGAAALAFSGAGVAYAQTVPSVDVTVTTSPTKAGTKSKPKSVKLKLAVKNDAASKTTAKRIAFTFPSTLKLSTSGLAQCTASEEKILAGPAKVCKNSIAGTGEAHALVNPFASTPAPLTFKVTPLVGKNELLFYLTQTPGNVKAILHGKISGKKLTIAVPEFLQQPAPGTYSALIDLSTTLSNTKGSKALFTSTGCKSKKHKVGVTVSYSPNPNPPSRSSASGSGNAKCS